MSDQIPNSESRPVSGFSKLALKGIGSVFLTQGAQESLVIEADPDIRSRIRSEVIDGTLTISYDFDLISDVFGLRFIDASPIRYHVSMINVNGISNSGAGTIHAGPIQSEAFELNLSGAGSVDLQSVTAQSTTVSLSGAGSIDLHAITAQSMAISLSGAGSIKIQKVDVSKTTATLGGAGSIRIESGKANDQQVRLSGVGSYEAGNVECQTAGVRVAGAGSAAVWVKETLDASLNSVGSINYYGTPRVTSQITGLGKLNNLGNK